MKKQLDNPIIMLIAAGVGSAVLLIASLFSSAVASGLKNPIDFAEYGALISALASGAAVGFVCAKKCSEKLLMYSGMGGAIIALLLIIISLLSGSGSSSLLITAGVPVCLLGGALLVCFLCVPKGNAKKKLKKLKKSYR